MQWLCPVRALRTYIKMLDRQKNVESLENEFLFGQIQKQTELPSFDRAMSVESFMTNVHVAMSKVDLAMNVAEYTLHCFRRGGVQWLDRMGWCLGEIVKWCGWSFTKGTEIDANIILRYLINAKEDQFADAGRGFQLRSDNYSPYYKNVLLE